jgi:hypothetical protein
VEILPLKRGFVPPDVSAVEIPKCQPKTRVNRIVIGRISTRFGRMVSRDRNASGRFDVRDVRPGNSRIVGDIDERCVLTQLDPMFDQLPRTTDHLARDQQKQGNERATTHDNLFAAESN